MNALFKRVISHPLVYMPMGIQGCTRAGLGPNGVKGYVIVKLIPELYLDREEIAALNEIVPAKISRISIVELHVSSSHPNLVELLQFLDAMEVALAIARRRQR